MGRAKGNLSPSCHSTLPKKKTEYDSLFKKEPGVVYFNPEEWHAFPFSHHESVAMPRRKKRKDDDE